MLEETIAACAQLRADSSACKTRGQLRQALHSIWLIDVHLGEAFSAELLEEIVSRPPPTRKVSGSRAQSNLSSGDDTESQGKERVSKLSARSAKKKKKKKKAKPQQPAENPEVLMADDDELEIVSVVGPQAVEDPLKDILDQVDKQRRVN